jgi:hypothetical protein
MIFTNPGMTLHMSANVVSELILVGKNAAAVTTIGGIGWGAMWTITSFFHKMTDIGDNILLLKTNHLPHIQAALDAHGTALNKINSDNKIAETTVNAIAVRLNDTKDSVDRLHDAFLDHIQSSAVPEVTVHVSGKKKVHKVVAGI